MPTEITHQTNKVTYKWTLNQDVETGTFWDGSPYVINKPGLKVIKVEMITEHGTESPNRVISDIELGFFGKPGFKGELYINGLMKNPKGMHDYDPTGKPRDKNYAFDSRSFGTFNKGWTQYKHVRDPATKKNIKVPIPTNENSSYPNFNLTSFLQTKSQLENGGIDLTSGDVLVVQWSNYDRNSSKGWEIVAASGYPYQRIISRSCALSYGTLFVLNVAPTSTSFRPPVVWPEEDLANRLNHIYPVSQIAARLPTNEELVTNPAPIYKVSNFANDPSFKTFCYGFPFGGGTNYSQALPLYSASLKGDIHSYGAYYQRPLISRLGTLYSSDVPEAQRLENLKVIVQWGIDAFGSIKSFASTSSGAGQKPCAARPWSIIAGYFLGVDSMRQPETQMMADATRTTGFLTARGAGTQIEDEDGGIEVGTIANEKMIELYGDPYAAGAEGLVAKKRWLALQTSLEALCYYKVKDKVGSVLDYRTLGKTHRRTFSGIGANLEQTNENTEYGLFATFKSVSSFKGNFAKIHWSTVPADLNKGWAASHDGKAPTFWYSYIKVISGPGSGDTLYRIIKSWGDFRNAKPDTQPNVTGYGFILDRPWQNGQPDSTSTFEMITCTEKNVGEVFYLIGPTRFKDMADANLSPTTPYGGICEALVIPLYGWMKYIETKTGTNADLDKGSVLTHEYVQKLTSISPYEWVSYATDRQYLGFIPWEIAILNKWYNRSNDRIEQAKAINWKTLPGVKVWHNVDVSAFKKIEGDFNDDGIVDEKDLAEMITKWGSNHPNFDLNGDGIIGVEDARMLLDKFGNTQPD